MTLRPILATCIAFVMFACNQQDEKQIETYISGTVTNPMGEIVQFSLNDTTLVDTLDAQGNFNVVFDIEKGTNIRFRHGSEFSDLYLRPGDKQKLTIDPNEFDETLKYTGIGSEINNYKAAMVLMGDTLFSSDIKYAYPEDSFLAYVKSVSDTKLALAAKFKIKDEDFLKENALSIRFNQYAQMMWYIDEHKYYTKDNDFSLSEDYYSFVKAEEINNASYLQIDNFKMYLRSIIDLDATAVWIENESMNYDSLSYVSMLSRFSSSEVLESMLYDFLRYNLTYLDITLLEEAYDKWLSFSPSIEKRNKIDAKKDQWLKLAPGSPAPSFNYSSIDGDTLSLEDFKGQVVYLDIWATWCGPCIREHPHMEKLQEEFKDEEVAFIAISIDAEPAPWRKMVEKKELGGIHLFAPGAWKSSICQDYMIQGIPRFILIDKEGNIVNVNADGPSGNIAEDLRALL